MTEQVVAYERRTISSQERIELVPLELPPTTFATEAIWFLPEPRPARGARRDAEAARDAARRRARDDRAPAALGDVRPLGHRRPLDEPPPADRAGPTVFVYDGHPGGVGITERGFEQFEGWVADTAELLARLPLRRRLPVVRPEPEVRQPERHARQGAAR